MGDGSGPWILVYPVGPRRAMCMRGINVVHTIAPARWKSGAAVRRYCVARRPSPAVAIPDEAAATPRSSSSRSPGAWPGAARVTRRTSPQSCGRGAWCRSGRTSTPSECRTALGQTRGTTRAVEPAANRGGRRSCASSRTPATPGNTGQCRRSPTLAGDRAAHRPREENCADRSSHRGRGCSPPRAARSGARSA